MLPIKNWIKRIRIEIFLLLLSLIALLYFGARQLNFEIYLYKIFLLTTSTIIVHLSRQFLFPDIGLWRLIYQKEPEIDPIIKAACILGVFIFMSAVIMSFMLGV